MIIFVKNLAAFDCLNLDRFAENQSSRKSQQREEKKDLYKRRFGSFRIRLHSFPVCILSGIDLSGKTLHTTRVHFRRVKNYL